MIIDRCPWGVDGWQPCAPALLRDEITVFMTDANAHRTIERLLRQQAALATFGSFAFKQTDLLAILTEAARICAASLEVPFCKICRYRPAENDLLIEAGCGWDPGVIGQVVSRADETSPQGRAYITREPVIIHDVRDGNSLILPDFYGQHGIISTVDVIISATDGAPYGIFEIDSPTLHQYDQHDINFLTGFANVLAEAVARTQKNEAIRQGQRMEAIGQLTGGVAHDFNNLLAIVIGYLDLLETAVPADGVAREMVTEALAASLRGAALTQHLLAFARRQSLDPSVLALNKKVADTTKLLARTFGDRVKIVLNLAPDVWPVIADRTQLEASIINLANNARDAMPNGGVLTFTTANRHLDADYAAAHAEVTVGDYAMIEVSDTGVGIAPGVLGQIFDPFFTTKAGKQGTGLGLSMVFGFLRQSNGHITVHSKVGEGTTFRLYLPRSEAATPAAETDAPTDVPRGNGEIVLVVEDAQQLRRIVARALQTLGYQVVEANTADEALNVLNSQPIAVVFSDIAMPGDMDGIGLARHIRQHWPMTKIILTSGFPEAQIAGTMGDLHGHVLMLNKPYRSVGLAQAVWKVLHT